MMIPFNRPLNLGGEAHAVAKALALGELASGQAISACEQWFERHAGCLRALMVPSCTHALELAALLAGIGAGDEVIMPSYTFASTANAFVLRGATPVFVDIRPDTCNMDEGLVEAAITPRTRAIVPVHYAGVACEMSSIMALADKYGLIVIEDAAQGMMATWRERPLGSIGHFGAYSFHASKNYTSGGEGGLLLVNDARFVERAEVLREKGTDRAAFLRGMVSRYSWRDVGSSYVPSEIQAACLLVQLDQAEQVNMARRAFWHAYRDAFAAHASMGIVSLPGVPEDCAHNGHLFYLILASASARDDLLRGAAAQGIGATSHYVPLHTSPAGIRWGRFQGADRLTSSLASRIVRLPLFYSLANQEQAAVIGVVRDLLGGLPS
jgi:dTDP-4-amino-4,6-dideoxygalactose transaminase